MRTTHELSAFTTPVQRVVRAMLCLSLIGSSAASQDEVELIAELTHGPLKEVSGITRSSYPGIFWVHNDSGDEARIFAIRLDGEPVIPPFMEKRFEDKVWPGLAVLNAWNVDWEDVTTDGDHLYICEMGNNGNARRDLGVYVLAEPNPLAVDRTRALRFLPIRYPDQEAYPGGEWHFDCEALFIADGKLHFLTKHRRTGQIKGWEAGTKLYRLDTESTDRENLLTLVGESTGVALPTSADMSPDGERLAVLTYSAVWLFERPEEGGDWLHGSASHLELDRERVGINEAITWADDQTLLIANEDRKLFRVSSAAFEKVDATSRSR